MAAVVESRKCVKCRMQYRTKVKKSRGSFKDVRVCPQCQHDNSPAR